MPSWDILTDAFQQVMNSVARGTLRIETERVPLAEIEDAWERDAHAHRLGVIPQPHQRAFRGGYDPLAAAGKGLAPPLWSKSHHPHCIVMTVIYSSHVAVTLLSHA